MKPLSKEWFESLNDNQRMAIVLFNMEICPEIVKDVMDKYWKHLAIQNKTPILE